MTGPNDPLDPYEPDQQQGFGPQYPQQGFGPQYPQQGFGPQYPQQGQPPYGQQPGYGEPYQPQYPQQYAPPRGYSPSYPPQDVGRQPGRPPGAALMERMGRRAFVRPAPRFGVSVTAVGVALVVGGILLWGFSYIGDSASSGIGSAPSDSRQYLGFALALAVVVLGYLLITRVRTGPLVTAGVAATALGIPVAVEFLTLDVGSSDLFNMDAVVWVSIIAYLLSYVFVPGARGHSFYLGLALLLLWEYAVGKAGSSSSQLSSDLFFPLSGSGPLGGVAPSLDTGTIAGLSLTFGVAYYLLAWLFDRTGRRGLALPFVVVGLPAVLVGIIALIPDAKRIGTGIVLLLVGLVLSRYGARYGRRFTTWFWALGAGAGGVVIISEFAERPISIGITMIVLGIVFVVGGWLFARALHEPDDLDETASVPSVAPAAT